ncbi:MAG: hypothetical protein D6698_08560 [Gammaproteobacteria bacterium]|nr:MAG: hypothetical protein D6698_08560 [Gammaproteobacteria bacterium]
MAENISTTTATKRKDSEYMAAANSLISGLSPKDRAWAVGIVTVLGVITGYFGNDISKDISEIKVQSAVIQEKISKLEDIMDDTYTYSRAKEDWQRQKEIDNKQDSAIELLKSRTGR